MRHSEEDQGLARVCWCSQFFSHQCKSQRQNLSRPIFDGGKTIWILHIHTALKTEPTVHNLVNEKYNLSPLSRRIFRTLKQMGPGSAQYAEWLEASLRPLAYKSIDIILSSYTECHKLHGHYQIISSTFKGSRLVYLLLPMVHLQQRKHKHMKSIEPYWLSGSLNPKVQTWYLPEEKVHPVTH